MKNNKTILIVDDDHGSRVAMESCLSDKGYELLIASSATSALSIMSEHPLHCVVSDWHLEDMPGTELLQKIRKGRNSTLPFLIITGVYTQPEDLEYAFRLGATDYIEKPVLANQKALVNRVKKALLTHQSLLEAQEQQQREEQYRITKVNGYEKLLHDFRGKIEDMIATTPLHKNTLRSLLYNYEEAVNKVNQLDKVKSEVEHVFPGFLYRLEEQFPKLKEDDLIICACLLLREGNRTIANRLKMSDESFRKRKMRLKEKLSIVKGEDFYLFLRGIYSW